MRRENLVNNECEDYRMKRSATHNLRALTLIEVITCASALLIVAVVLLPFVAGDNKISSKRTVCLSNVKQIALAMLMYDNDWEKAPAANHWMDQCESYRKSLLDSGMNYHCPFSKSAYGYAMRTKLAGVDLEKLKNPEKEPLCFDTEYDKRNAHTDSVSIPPFSRHLNQSVGFADGHVRRLKSG